MKPKIAVLLAAYNGLSYLPQQVESILAQKEVELTLFASVDSSGDGTEQWFDRLAENDARVVLLPHGRHFGGAAKNFFRLLLDVDCSGFDYVAFADQDDIWFDEKLKRHAKMSKSHGADGVSSNVMAFWPNGKQKLIQKAQPQREFDFLFESAGPGCTFLITVRLAGIVKDLLNSANHVCEIQMHDWLIYAVCRSIGRSWFIDTAPSIMYRQHHGNVIGANKGLLAIFSRVRLIKNGWYKKEVLKIMKVSLSLSSNPNVNIFFEILSGSSYFQHLKLIKLSSQFRRKFSERIFLTFMIIFGFL